MTTADGIKLALTFLNVFAGAIAGVSSAPEEVKWVCVALVGACGACLLKMERLGTGKRRTKAQKP